MNVAITGKHIDIGDALRRHVSERLADGVSKYFADPIEAHVTFSHEGPLYRSRISLHIGHGLAMEGQAEAAEIYEAFNLAAEHVTKQARRQKRKVRNKHA
ncbi:MAG: ribosome hibernation-promoting factor, HPF/YfiA family [Alphaproteobacteria bacterium]